MTFISDTFQVPQKLEAADFTLRKLCYADAELDYEAVMSSIGIIKKTRGFDGWPTTTLTLEENKNDLIRHQQEFESRISFAYTLMNLDETKCLGCVYLYKPGHRNEESLAGDVDVNFWVTQEAFDRGLYKKLYEVIDPWLRNTWHFKNVVYTNETMPT